MTALADLGRARQPQAQLAVGGVGGRGENVGHQADYRLVQSVVVVAAGCHHADQ